MVNCQGFAGEFPLEAFTTDDPLSFALRMVIALPVMTGFLTFIASDRLLRSCLLIGCALGHSALTFILWLGWTPDSWRQSEWLGLDPAGMFFLAVTSFVFLLVALYTPAYLAKSSAGKTREEPEDNGILFACAPEPVFVACMQLFLASMTLVCLSTRFGLLWIAIEATTLASAPLIYFNKSRSSLAAVWRYILICSIGIGLALVGNILLALACFPSGIPLVLGELINNAESLHPLWLQAAFVFFLVGYGTKAGLAPLHTWLPNAHSEAPALVSALLSGSLLNCAFLGVLRAHRICLAAGLGDFSSGLLLFFGLFSVVFSAVFIFLQRDFKRTLAYSSVENMGIISLGFGVGGLGVLGALLHVVNHSAVKSSLFLTAGNIINTYHTRKIGEISGMLGKIPVSAVLWIAGFLAVSGSPPFGTFISKFTVFKAAMDSGRYWQAFVFLLFIAVIFIAMSRCFLGMAQGGAETEKAHERKTDILPPLALLAVSLLFGTFIPASLYDFIMMVVSEFQ